MRVAIVTGSTRGIGRATARELGDQGWWVLGTGRDEAEGKELEAELQNRSGGAFVAADLREDRAPSGLVDRVMDEHGRLDLLVNNAGIHFLGRIPDIPVERFDELMNINLRAAYLAARAAIPPMRRQGGGVIVNVSSEAGLSAVAEQAPYNISKAAMIMLTRSIVADHAREGIRSVSICPGTTLTPLVEAAIASAEDPDAHRSMLAESRPANRLGDPDEVARVIAFVARDDVSYLNGGEVVIDGGKNAV
jgi:NAD(P)-dependent dehydrogenase (short-subunit alcohol dehydrogenase family)